jgi:hypothetical protein
MKKTLLLTILLLLITSPVWGLTAAIQAVVSAGGAASCTTSNDSKLLSQETTSGSFGIGADVWRANTIVLSTTTTLTQVSIYIRQLIQCDITISIRSSLTGSDITNLSKTLTNRAADGGPTYVDFVFDTPVQLASGTYYYVLRGVTADSISYYYKEVGVSGYQYSANAGASWSELSDASGTYQIYGCQP